MPDCGVKIHLGETRFAGLGVVHIFQVHAPNPRHLLLEKGNCISATINVVACIKTQTQLISREQGEESINFLGGFDVTARMMVKGDSQTESLTLRDHFSDR